VTDVVLAVDIGGTKIAAGLADRNAVVLTQAAGETPGLAGPQEIVAMVVKLAGALLNRMPDVSIRAVGIGTAGVVDVRSGSIISSTDTIAGWAGTPLADLVRSGMDDHLPTGAVVHVQNDVDAHALGEFHHGAGVGADSMLVVAVGTGVGAGVVLGGHILRGARHVAGEIGHVPTPGAEHLDCPCGRPGHLEAIGSGIGLYKHYLSLGGDRTETDARGVAARAQNGDALAARAVHDSATAVGRAIAATVTVLDPERVVITGGVPNIGDAWWTPMLDGYRAEVIDTLQHLPLIAGTLGSDAPLRGAAASAWAELKGKS
jgi:glucokinase